MAILAGIFAAILLLGLILGDWVYFVRLTPEAARYGCGVARRRDEFASGSVARLQERFGSNGALSLPHGIARYYPDQGQIAIRPQYHLFSVGFRTAWPVKGLLYLSPDGEARYRVLCVKRIPWSSAIITLVWFLLVGVGTVAFLVSYAMQGGFTTLRGLLMGFGILGIGLLVVAFGLVTVLFSYRLESTRLERVYHELRAAAGEPGLTT
ncbi:MAG TPA: hypothetical protein VFS39_15320 [Nitrospira sp.]|nr:hypothetical protein [Nitrospira sp.]